MAGVIPGKGGESAGRQSDLREKGEKSLLAGPLVMWCGRLGVAPAMVMAAFGLCCCNCYLLPLDTVPLIPYATGYYDMFDMPQTTVWLQLFLVIASALWLRPASGIL